MKIQVMYDRDGEITSVGVSVDHSRGPIRLMPEDGQQVAEIELPDLKAPENPEDEQSLQQLLKRVRGHRVKIGKAGAYLVDK